MKRQRAYAPLLAVAATFFAAGHASAQTPAAVPAPAVKAPPIAAPSVVRRSPTVQLAGQTLHLNGKGTRYRAVVRVYDIGLYATTKVSSLEQLAAAPGPKRLQLITLRELKGDMLGVAMVQGMQDNAPSGERIKLIPQMERLSRIFGAEPSAAAGTALTIDYVPGKGTAFYLNGEQKGEAVADPSYFIAVARIWLGNKPADATLKDALLSIEAKRAESGGG